MIVTVQSILLPEPVKCFHHLIVPHEGSCMNLRANQKLIHFMIKNKWTGQNIKNKNLAFLIDYFGINTL